MTDEAAGIASELEGRSTEELVSLFRNRRTVELSQQIEDVLIRVLIERSVSPSIMINLPPEGALTPLCPNCRSGEVTQTTEVTEGWRGWRWTRWRSVCRQCNQSWSGDDDRASQGQLPISRGNGG